MEPVQLQMQCNRTAGANGWLNIRANIALNMNRKVVQNIKNEWWTTFQFCNDSQNKWFQKMKPKYSWFPLLVLVWKHDSDAVSEVKMNLIVLLHTIHLRKVIHHYGKLYIPKKLAHIEKLINSIWFNEFTRTVFIDSESIDCSTP